MAQPCFTPDQKPGGCIELRQCSVLSQLAQNPRISNIEANFLRQSQCAYFNNHPWVKIILYIELSTFFGVML